MIAIANRLSMLIHQKPKQQDLWVWTLLVNHKSLQKHLDHYGRLIECTTKASSVNRLFSEFSLTEEREARYRPVNLK
jgi:hypothetical protein